MIARGATRKVQGGGGCACSAGGSAGGPGLFGWLKGGSYGGARGGYRATRKNRELLAKLRRGESIGFTATASLKAKGLLARTSRKYRGKKILGPKYR
jgi:hypothetical protein